MRLLILLLAVGTCRQPKDKVVKIPKPTPARYVGATNPAFSRRQDSLYYGQDRFSGCVYNLYANGDTQTTVSYLNGLEEGFTRKWYPNKQLAEERLYVDGKKEGVHKAWWGDGRPKFIFDVSNDEYVGELKEWYPSGLLAKDFHYEKGQEEGSERLWWDDGSVRANYVVKKGKKYGLIGIKLCKNPYDSINKK